MKKRPSALLLLCLHLAVFTGCGGGAAKTAFIYPAAGICGGSWAEVRLLLFVQKQRICRAL